MGLCRHASILGANQRGNEVTLSDAQGWVVLAALIFAAFGLYRTTQIKALKDSNDYLRERDKDREQEVLDMKREHSTQMADLRSKHENLKAEYTALSRVVTNEAYMTALAAELGNKFQGMAEIVTQKLEEHNEAARDHWDDEKEMISSLVRVANRYLGEEATDDTSMGRTGDFPPSAG